MFRSTSDMLRFSALFVKGRVTGVKIFAVEAILCDAERIAKALEVHNLAHAEEAQNVDHVGIVAKTNEVVVRHARLLLC